MRKRESVTAITDEARQPIPAYVIARVQITDPVQYRLYLNAVPPIIEKYGGKALARSINPLRLEGEEESRRIILLHFPSVEKAKEFYDSPEYREARKLREGAAIGEMVVVGVGPERWDT